MRIRNHIRSNVVAYLALFFALGGTAIAAKPLVTGADVQDDSLTGADVLESSLGEVPIAGSATVATGARNTGSVNRQTLPGGGGPSPLFEAAVNGIQISGACTVVGPKLELSLAPDREPPEVMYGYTLDTPGDSESGFINHFDDGDGIDDGISVAGPHPVLSLVVGSGFDFARIEIAGRSRGSGCEFIRWKLQSKDPGV